MLGTYFLCPFLPALMRTIIMLPSYSASDFVDDALGATESAPYFSLQTSSCGTSGYRGCNLTCLAATDGRASFSWFLGGTQMASEQEFSVNLRTSLLLQYSRFTIVITDGVQTVSCKILVAESWSVVLSADIVSGTPPLHLFYGDKCAMHSRHCTGSGLMCDIWSSRFPQCSCDSGTYREDEIRMCLGEKKTGESCVLSRGELCPEHDTSRHL
ncbi:uncharacterized protein LOC135387097 isoform X2 [Ornithodoros turicata]|uniref:uncharacterized protein LOC135387097 isoform X2 n=1 Tax=Ornithodoros turicata TaxID=34597 RepID=UPI00313A2602